MRIIPAIDIIDGKCVRLSKGDYDTKVVYNDNPLEVAKSFQDAGIQYLHVVDLDGAKSKHSKARRGDSGAQHPCLLWQETTKENS